MAEYVIITDTSCLILLDKIGALNLLYTLYRNVLITPQIAAEFKTALPAWIQVVSVKNSNLLKAYANQVDLGEASAIA
ncbi:hypothetical protein FW774_04755 (plasmid) [Pedobacter sp. BS3]|uniref:hypothetical protein n=1 Tax=Pedobacter sp. BS3 TaxID=2567937 RepID=UPI0011EBDD9B|nr:hypothetical protein [Pedobacter sp. BS3]TZF86360.1 hypothetical protein FW774_04755 [Pedobacter sp. BS3]